MAQLIKNRKDIIKARIGVQYDILRRKTLEDFVNNQNDLPFETMVKNKELLCNERWTPKSKKTYFPCLLIEYSESWEKKIKDNIIYNLQYLEFLQKELDELCIRSIINNQLNKNYLIVAMSIIEGLFTYYLKKQGVYWYEEWKSYKKDRKENSQIEEIEGIPTKKEIEYFHKVDKFEVPMTLDSMIKIIKDKDLIDFGDKDIFLELNSNRKLRNEIHLATLSDFKTDYLTFTDDVQKMIKKLLYNVITNPVFFVGDERQKLIIFDFLID